MTSGSSIKNVLVPLDLGPGSDRVLGHVRLLAAAFDAAVTIYHVVEVPDHRFPHWAFAHEHAVWMEAERQARDALERRATELGGRVTAIVERAPSVHQAIVDLARRLSADLLVMATHGREGIAQVLLGSVTTKVLERVHRPVLCVRATEHEDAFPYRRIMVTTDFSLASRLVFPLAAELARRLEAEILGVHVTRSRTLASISGIPDPDLVVIPSEALLLNFLRDFDGLPVKAQIQTGTVWERIVHAAREEKADLIVMSRRGHDSLSDRIVGSNSARVVRHAPCPVLVA